MPRTIVIKGLAYKRKASDRHQSDRRLNRCCYGSNASHTATRQVAVCLFIGGRLGALRLLFAATPTLFFLLGGRAARTATVFTARTAGAITRLAFAIRALTTGAATLGAFAIFPAATCRSRSGVRLDGKHRNGQQNRCCGNRQAAHNF